MAFLNILSSAPASATVGPRGGNLAERRRGERFVVPVQASVSTTDGVILSSMMLDISASGFRTRSAMVLAAGTRLAVRFRHGMPRRAEVAWQRGEQVGCRFQHPLTRKQLVALTAI